MIKLWAFSLNSIQGRALPDRDDAGVLQETFDRNLTRLAASERLGFEGVLFGEHHFVDLICPNPNLLIAALAKMTGTLRLGVLGNVLVLHQPWRLLEDLGMLDYITDGRLEVGVAVGVPQELPLVGLAAEEVRPRYEELLDFLDEAWDQKIARHEGQFWNYAGVPVSPRMRPEARRRKWMAVYSTGSAEAAAKRGYKLCTGFQSTEKATRAFDAYRHAASNAGWDAEPDDIGIRRQVLICDTDEEARTLNAELLALAQQRMVVAAAELMNQTSANAHVKLSDDIMKSGMMDAASPQIVTPDSLKLENVMPPGLLSIEDEFIFGSPKTVSDVIVDQCRQTGSGNFMFTIANGLTHDEADAQFARWKQVLPALHKAKIGAAA